MVSGGAEGRWAADAEYCSYADGSTYIGQISGGKRHGHGMWRGSACQYEGQWVDDQQHGKGHQTWSDGRVYTGEFKCQKFSGQGRMVWTTSSGMQTYEGSYKDDLKHGPGKFMWADGRSYDGQWAKGQRHGVGLYKNSKGEKTFGNWANGKYERRDAGGFQRKTFNASPLVPRNAWMFLDRHATVQVFVVAFVLLYARRCTVGSPSAENSMNFTWVGSRMWVAHELLTAAASSKVEGRASSLGGTCNATAINASGPFVVGSTCTSEMSEGSTCVVVCPSGCRADGTYTCSQSRMSGFSYCQHDNLRGHHSANEGNTEVSPSHFAACIIAVALVAAIGVPSIACYIKGRSSATSSETIADLSRSITSWHPINIRNLFMI